MSSTPIDGTSIHAWFFEPVTKDNGNGSLTTDGLEYIATHKYVSGKYTILDNLLNPFWQYLTNLLPITLAPNMVTTIGGLHCAVAYALIWYYSPQFDNHVPDWVVFIAGFCSLVYYTLDCMDGKQARRTNSSSPLGQLFDHGFDCLNTLIYIALISSVTMCGRSKSYFVLQVSMQFSFFVAQWEEYHTHTLPHAAGQVGVTEINYGTGIVTIINSFLNRESIWKSRLDEITPMAVTAHLTPSIAKTQLRHFAAVMTGITMIPLILLSLNRVCKHENVRNNKNYLSAISKLLTPLFVGVTPFLLPLSIIQNNTRYLSISTGLLFCLLTVKMICFSMAKMTYAAVQGEALPYFLICLWIRMDGNITEVGSSFLLALLCFWYGYRLMKWAGNTIEQICSRLDIFCFTIKSKVE